MSFLQNKKFLVTGAGAQLAVYFTRTAAQHRLNATALNRGQLDITDASQLREAIKRFKPNVILNCASYNLIDHAEEDPSDAFQVNALAVERLAEMCRDRGIFLVHYSSAHVFDGTKGSPYLEDDPVYPINVYGQSKYKGEAAIQAIMKDYLILRLSWVFGTGKNCFLTKVLSWAKNTPLLKISSDEISVPAYSQDVIDGTIRSLEKGISGLFHLTSHGSCSRAEYVREFVTSMGLKNEVLPVPASSFNLKAKRPLYSCMANSKICHAAGLVLPSWHDGLKRFTQRLKQHEF
jgi:dTDP-4-dehydrorhamnose reductase